jgi:hypothetical protein
MKKSDQSPADRGTYDRIDLAGLVQSPEVFPRKDLIKVARRFAFSFEDRERMLGQFGWMPGF